MMKLILMFFAIGGICTYCQKNTISQTPEQLFDSVPVVKPLTPLVQEISGIADSEQNQGLIWGHEDSGRPPQLYRITHQGQVTGTVFIKNVTNRDWEEMDLAGGKIYIGETGDNNQVYGDYKFYIFPEPVAGTDTIHQVETIEFTYPDGSHDAEAFVVDPSTKDIYIITKRDNPSRIYRLPYPYTNNTVVSAVGSLPYSGVVGAAISSDGKEIIIKTYMNLFHYTRQNGETIAQALQKSFKTLKYMIEPQGEAISFAADGSGFFTISEKGFSSSVNVFFYKRN